jgi:hypothetical protein
MVKSAWLAILCVALSVSSTKAFVQEEHGGIRKPEIATDTLTSSSGSSLSFEKLLNTFHWAGIAAYNASHGPVSVSFTERFFSTLIRTDRNLIRDEQSLDLSLKHHVIKNLRAAAEISSFLVSDNQAVNLGKVSSHVFYGGVEYQPIEHLMVEPLVGVRYDNQVDQQDKGPSYQLRFFSQDLLLDGYRTELSGKNIYDNLTLRTLETFNDTLSIEKLFFEQTRNRIQLQYNHNRRDFYLAVDPAIQRQYSTSSNIETRTEDAFTVSNILDYNVGTKMFLTFQENIFSRGIGRRLRYRNLPMPTRLLLNANIDEFKIDGSVQARYTSGSWIDGMVRFFYQERDEQHSIEPDNTISQVMTDSATRMEERKNNHARRTSLALNLNIALTSSDSVAFSGSSSLLRYDTPNLNNDDDRDELWYLVNLTTIHHFNRHLHLRVTAEANLAHLVYLAGTRSADNTWNRIFRLSPRLEYIPADGFLSVNTFEVLANYTIYDFEYPLSPTRSFAFRQFGYIDSTTIELTRRLTFEWFNHLRFYERGELQWSEFAERPINYFEEKMYIGKAVYQIKQGLLFIVGIRYFSQTRFDYVGTERTIESCLRSIGPLTGIRWDVGTRTALMMNGWYENQSQTGIPDRSFVNLAMSLNVRI